MSDDLLTKDLGHSVQAEMCLLGNIIKNMELIPQYKNVLTEEAFEDKACRLIFCLLEDYYETYGSEFEPFKLAMLFDRYAEDARKICCPIRPDRFYKEVLRPIEILGVTNLPADNSAFQAVIRNSVIRSLASHGISVDQVLAGTDVYKLTADDILKAVQKTLDELSMSASVFCSEDLGSNLVEQALSFLDAPEFGLQTPFDFINHHMHGLYKNDVTMLGGVSNSGKGRCLTYILAYLVCVENQSVYLMTNEMTIEDYYKVLICTIVNSPPIQKLHGKYLTLTQTDITQSRFHDDNGNIIERLDGEDRASFKARLLEQSSEYRDYDFVVQWFHDNYADKFHVVNVSDDYSKERLSSEIRKAETKGCSVVAYDTLKAYQSAEWTDLYLTATALTERIKFSRSGLHGIFTFQLTDDINYIYAEKMGPGNIAHSKNIIHVADNMLMFQRLPFERNRFYSPSASNPPAPLRDDKEFSIFKIIKNRRGGGKNTLYGVQINLDLNCWGYISELTPSSAKRSA